MTTSNGCSCVLCRELVGTEEGLDGDDAVAARLVFDDDRLPPFDLQLFGEQPCALALHI